MGTNAKKLVKEFERTLKADPDNIVVRVKLAAALRELGRSDDAVSMYRSVAEAYHRQGRLAQAMAVCRSVLEIEPAQPETQALLLELDTTLLQRNAAAAQVAAQAPPAPAGLPAVATGKRHRRRFDGGFEKEESSRGRRSGFTPSSHSGLTPSGSAPLPVGREVTPSRLPLPAPHQEGPLRPASPPPVPPGPVQVRAPSLRFPAPRPSSHLPTPDRSAYVTVPEQPPVRGAIDPRLLPLVRAETPHPTTPMPTLMPPPPRVSQSRNAQPGPELEPQESPEPPENDEGLTIPAHAPRWLDTGSIRDAQDEWEQPTGPGPSEAAGGRAPSPVGAVLGRDLGQPRARTTLERVKARLDTDRSGGDGLALPCAFDQPFAASLEALAPDGSTIEQPLSIFSKLSHEALLELMQRMSRRHFEAGEIVLREGDPGDACFVIQHGSVRVLKKDPQASTQDLIEIARLGPGSLFGEFALLADRRRHATVQAMERCEMFEIPRRLLRELAATYADVGPALERFYRERLVSTLLATAPFFQPLPDEERGKLMARFVPRRVEAGTAILREGDVGGGLYLIVLGTVEITKWQNDRRAVLLASLGEGAYFGEMSLLQGGTASATVTAAGPVELAQLPPQEFYDVVSAFPVLWDELRREAHRREIITQNLMAGDTHVV
jgi:CRP-like cAMP-binding protein